MKKKTAAYKISYKIHLQLTMNAVSIPWVCVAAAILLLLLLCIVCMLCSALCWSRLVADRMHLHFSRFTSTAAAPEPARPCSSGGSSSSSNPNTLSRLTHISSSVLRLLRTFLWHRSTDSVSLYFHLFRKLIKIMMIVRVLLGCFTSYTIMCLLAVAAAAAVAKNADTECVHVLNV